MAKALTAKTLTKGARITGAQRGAIGVDYARRYADGESIRAIAESAGRSFGFVHGVLREAGVTLRSRGGATRGAAHAAQKSAVSNAAAKNIPASNRTQSPA